MEVSSLLKSVGSFMPLGMAPLGATLMGGGALLEGLENNKQISVPPGGDANNFKPEKGDIT